MADAMISLKRYLYGETEQTAAGATKAPSEACSTLVSAYDACLADIGASGAQACPSLAQDLEKGLARVRDALAASPGIEEIHSIQSSVHDLLHSWGDRTAEHYREKAGEMKDLLVVMSRTAESLGQKDDRYTQQLNAMTAQLESVVSLDDVSRIRTSVEESARELKASIAQMAAESKAVVDHLRVEVLTYRNKLEQAEYIASRDALTGVGSRRWIEERIWERVEAESTFSILLIDIREFGHINAEYGNLVGDVLLKEFARELRSCCRFSDLVARWGGDEFLVVMDCAGAEARAQIARLHSWVCGPYCVGGRGGMVHVRLDICLGMAEHRDGEDMQSLLERADADLCGCRAAARKPMSA